MTAPTRTRLLTDAEMDATPHFANLRSGARARPPRVGIPRPTLIAALLVSIPLWAALIWIARAVWTALTGDLSMMEF